MNKETRVSLDLTDLAAARILRAKEAEITASAGSSGTIS